MPYLTTKQTKLDKSVALGYATAGLQLSPATELADHDPAFANRTTCAFAGYCAHGCLSKTGQNIFDPALQARLTRTRAYLTDRPAFLAAVSAELRTQQRRAARKGLQLAVRPNVLSDLYRLGVDLALAHPDVPHYDYTKVLGRHLATRPANYHVTYSYSERTTPDDLALADALGLNIAVIFDTPSRDPQPFPATYRLCDAKTRPVISGDDHDLRFLDPQGGYIVALSWKGSTHAMRAARAVGQILPLTV